MFVAPNFCRDLTNSVACNCSHTKVPAKRAPQLASMEDPGKVRHVQPVLRSSEQGFLVVPRGLQTSGPLERGFHPSASLEEVEAQQEFAATSVAEPTLTQVSQLNCLRQHSLKSENTATCYLE